MCPRKADSPASKRSQLQATGSELPAALLRFLVRLVLAAAGTELLELETAGGRLLVLRRRVVPLLALSALQCDDFPHLLILTDSGLRRLFASEASSQFLVRSRQLL